MGADHILISLKLLQLKLDKIMEHNMKILIILNLTLFMVVRLCYSTAGISNLNNIVINDRYKHIVERQIEITSIVLTQEAFEESFSCGEVNAEDVSVYVGNCLKFAQLLPLWERTNYYDTVLIHITPFQGKVPKPYFEVIEKASESAKKRLKKLDEIKHLKMAMDIEKEVYEKLVLSQLEYAVVLLGSHGEYFYSHSVRKLKIEQNTPQTYGLEGSEAMALRKKMEGIKNFLDKMNMQSSPEKGIKEEEVL